MIPTGLIEPTTASDGRPLSFTFLEGLAASARNEEDDIPGERLAFFRSNLRRTVNKEILLSYREFLRYENLFSIFYNIEMFLLQHDLLGLLLYKQAVLENSPFAFLATDIRVFPLWFPMSEWVVVVVVNPT